jgi:transcriptional regulator with XRE-family HTH domain
VASGSAISASADLNESVRRRLRALRLRRALTLAQVAAAAAMDPSTLSRLESGARRLTLDHLPVLARALGVRVDDLLACGSRRVSQTRHIPTERRG